MEYVLCQPADGFRGYYYARKTQKKRITLHFTAGYLPGDIASLTNKKRGHVSVPFVIARDGTIYQLFPSSEWSYHLGPGARGTNESMSKSSIGIELSNIGYLVEKEGNLETVYSRLLNEETGNEGPVKIYCSLNDHEAYQKISQPYREHVYFATFTSAQYDSLAILLRYLSGTYQVPLAFLPEEKRYKIFSTAKEAINYRGVCSHVNFRGVGKWDIGPAFDWDRLIQAVSAHVVGMV
ncbi:MAG: N-acetylmuramoyl-L-alanine amidase [Bacteroidota bacterium]